MIQQGGGVQIASEGLGACSVAAEAGLTNGAEAAGMGEFSTSGKKIWVARVLNGKNGK